ncbi:hypothetical protein [Ensifer sp. SSB1]|jgi:hypothetical protein|uniref:hypothetical protein n=1 Tax=Ensifer sp. SSB1 TaxID=2795385 RepID=UPI000DE4EEFA|nr:hypothetical protein [Ensifer sp. SSB1]MBK5568500.1 hypothetical protein [Ensifer sp. SSB1]
MKITRIAAIAALAFSPILLTSPAHALSMTECSAKYKAAQAAGSLNGMKWNDFRKAQCGTDTAAKPAAMTSEEPTTANTDNAPEPAATTAKAPKGVVFPKAVDPKYSSESAGKARMHTCLDQYKADKANNSLGDLTWIKKGGGYYSMCNTQLKHS